jgi:hypothetical protein
MLQSVKSARFGLVAIMILPAFGSVLERREENATTSVVCGSQYSWMNNKDGESPCLVAAILSGACATGTWNIPALGPDQQYSVPNATLGTLNYCSCSWAVYNLLAGCTACQGSASIENWSPYSQPCGSFETDTYFPTDKVIVPNDTFLPYWAATNPTTWLEGSFDVDQAQSINGQGKSDIDLSNSSSTSSTHKSSDTGAIAGGVVGGLAAAAIAVVLFLIMRRRRRRVKGRIRSLLDPLPQSFHGRSPSDSSQLTQKMTDPLAYLPETRQTASPPSVYTASTLRTHAVSPSVNSLPYDVSIITGPASNAPSPPPQMMLPPIGGSMASPDNLENVIVPYTVSSPASDAPTDRKRADANLYPIFENQDFQPGLANQSTPARGRFNPPTYNESIASGDASVMRNVSSSAGSIDQKGRTHGHQNSSDTIESHSTTITHANINRSARPVSSSVGGSDDIGSNLGFASPPSVVAVGYTAINSPTSPGTNVFSVDGSVIVGDDVA